MSRYSQPINLDAVTNYNVADQMNQPPMSSRGESDLLVEPTTNLEITVPYFTETASPIEELHVQTPVEFDTAGNKYVTNKKAWGTDNADAIMVFERASSDFTAGVISINAQNGNTAIIVGRQKGRKSVTIWVPSTYTNSSGTSSTPNGVTVAQTEGEIQNNAAVQLNPGDSITINTEAPIWAGVLPGQTTGICQFLVEYNPAGGELGGQ